MKTPVTVAMLLTMLLLAYVCDKACEDGSVRLAALYWFEMVCVIAGAAMAGYPGRALWAGSLLTFMGLWMQYEVMKKRTQRRDVQRRWRIRK